MGVTRRAVEQEVTRAGDREVVSVGIEVSPVEPAAVTAQWTSWDQLRSSPMSSTLSTILYYTICITRYHTISFTSTKTGPIAYVRNGTNK